MTSSYDNRFEDFFADGSYVALKNLLYNYLLRKRAVEKCARRTEESPILEVGSGLSPMITDSDRVIYSELSFPALRFLKNTQKRGSFVVADAAHLPFKAGTFPQVICSEVLEHLPKDRRALKEMARVMKQGGSLILTFPHRQAYFAGDDRFVNHFRRYELDEMMEMLREAGLSPTDVQKVLGPLEKITMMTVIAFISLLQRRKGKRRGGTGRPGARPLFISVFKWLNRCFCLPVWLDARITPRFLAAVLLIRSTRA
jgi:SAM-dependent methyltransferase